MQNQNVTRTCDNPNCQGTGSPYSTKTVETITNGVSDRPDINWIFAYNTTRTGDNKIGTVGDPLMLCGYACCIALATSKVEAAVAAAQAASVTAEVVQSAPVVAQDESTSPPVVG